MMACITGMERSWVARLGMHTGLALALLLTGAAVGPAQGQPAGAAPATVDGRYEGTGILLGGQGCAGTIGQRFGVTLTLSAGEARMPLGGGGRAIAGPVGPRGELDRLSWRGDQGVVDASRGVITRDSFVLDYSYDWADRRATGCTYRYEGRRIP